MRVNLVAVDDALALQVPLHGLRTGLTDRRDWLLTMSRTGGLRP